VEEDQAAVDEGPEERVPADADFSLIAEVLVVGGEPDLSPVGLLGHREQVVRAGVVEDPPVVGGCLLGHDALL
jgi:hypothetical protein